MKNVAMFLSWFCAIVCIIAAMLRIAANQDGPAVVYGIGALVCIWVMVLIKDNVA